MATEETPDIEVEEGAEYRLANGDEVIVSKVEGTAVSGHSRMAAHTSSGVKGTIGLAVWEGTRDQFRDAERIR